MHADHFIWSAYGTWLPSCPRESWPRYIRSWERTRPDLQPDHDPYRLNRMLAEKTRRFPPVLFSPIQMRAIAEGFERCARNRQAYVWGCCIMPEYVQLLLTCPRTPASQLMGLMRSEATKKLCELNLHPLSSYGDDEGGRPLMWSHTKWHQVLKDDESVREAISYLEELPARTGHSPQHWSLVKPFESLERCREECEEYKVQLT